jgi:septum formation protein
MESTLPAVPAELVLASISPRRHTLLDLLGIPFRIVPSAVDESQLAASSAGDLARVAAREKCLDVAIRLAPGAWVLGADTVVHFMETPQATAAREIVLGKPTDPDDAVRMLRTLSGRTHCVTTGVAVCPPGDPATARERVRVRSLTTRVRFRPLADGEIRGYVATGEPLDKAGAYAVQALGGTLIASVDGDLPNVVGLPLSLVIEMLAPGYPGLAMPTPQALARICGVEPH